MSGATWFWFIFWIIAIVVIIILIIVFVTTKSKDDKTLTDYKNQIASLNGELFELRNQISSSSTKNKTCTDNLDALNKKLFDLQTNLDTCEASLTKAQTEATANKSDLDTCNSLLLQAKTNVSSTNELDAYKASLEKVQAEATANKSSLDACTASLTEANTSIENYKKTIEQLNADIATIKTQLETSKNDLANCNTINSGLKNDLNNCLTKISDTTTSLSNAINYGTIYNLQSVENPNNYIRHMNFLGYVEPIDPKNQDSQFTAVQMLGDVNNTKGVTCGNANKVSFRSVNYPDHYLSMSDYRVNLEKIIDEGAKNNASWCETCDNNGCFYEPAFFPNYYLKQKEGTNELWIEPNKSMFKRIAVQ